MTAEIERLKVLEGKIAHIIDHVQKLSGENEKLRLQIKDLKAEKKDAEETAKRLAKLDEDVKTYENEREAIRGRVEVLIAQIDKLGM